MSHHPQTVWTSEVLTRLQKKATGELTPDEEGNSTLDNLNRNLRSNWMNRWNKKANIEGIVRDQDSNVHIAGFAMVTRILNDQPQDVACAKYAIQKHFK